MSSTKTRLIELIRSVDDLSSRDPKKFDPVRNWLSERYQVPAEEVGVKYLADPKNFGNRLGEALQRHPRLLVLLVEGSSPDTVLGVAESRLPLSPTTVVALIRREESDAGWTPVLCLGAETEPLVRNLTNDLDVRAHAPNIQSSEGTYSGYPTPDPESVGLLLSRLAAGRSLETLRGCMAEVTDKLADYLDLEPTSVRAKSVLNAKNVENRMAEALGKQPSCLLVLTTAALSPKVESSIRRHQASGQAGFLGVVLAYGEDSTWSTEVLTPSTQSEGNGGGAGPEDVSSNSLRSGTVPVGDGYSEARVVTAMVDLLPFDAHAKSLIEEHVTSEEAPEPYETATYGYVADLLADPDTRVVVLTGDAGHGKTHLCRRILEQAGLDAQEARDRLRKDGEGTNLIQLEEAHKPIRLVKDLSDFNEDVAADILDKLMSDDETVSIVSANEGRLRSVIAKGSEKLIVLLETLETGIHDGVTSIEAGVHVINLNYQSIAPRSRGFFVHVLDSWTKDGRRWRACGNCAASPTCPILRNRGMLEGGSGEAFRRREGLVQLVRIAEQSGYVLTIRGALILASYLLTGGVDCRRVHALHESGQLAELRSLWFERLLFERALAEHEQRHLGVLEKIRRSDPGLVPHRDIDERIITDLEEEAKLGNSAWIGRGRLAQSLRQQRHEASELLELVRTRRRRSYFDDPPPGTNGSTDRARRIGLQYFPEFDHVQGADETPTTMLAIVEKVIVGLHVIQGIRPKDRSNLFLVDPAFSRSGSATSVIAVRIPKKRLWLWGLHEYWQKKNGGREPGMLKAVDWLDRQVVLCDAQSPPAEVITLDLLQFEFVLRAAEGVVFPEFHAADRRRLLSKLARICESESQLEDDIRVVAGDTIRHIVVERDRSIEVHGGE